MHAAFLALIVFGVTWQSSPTAPLVAELWDKLPPAKSAPPPEPPKPEPEPPKPEPPKPEPPKAPPEPPKPEVKPEPPKPDPEIAEKLEREKREKAKREKLEREKLEREREEKKKQEEAKKKREQEELARKKQEEERQRKEAAEKQRLAEQARQAAVSARQKQIDEWTERIRNKIRGKANVPDTVPTGTEIHVRLRILPGGDVLEATVTKPSGNPAYDAAIQRAIRSAQPLPVPPADSELFPQFRDLILNIKHER
ncbi:MAG: energy transducer TonB [Bacillota bacterium]